MRALTLTRPPPRVMLEARMPVDAPRAQLIHIETDRRLGHEWDEWDGKPLARNGDFSAPPGLFFQFGALTLIVGLGATALLLFLLAPRLEALLPALPALLWGALAVVAGGGALWFALLLVDWESTRLDSPPPLISYVLFFFEKKKKDASASHDGPRSVCLIRPDV